MTICQICDIIEKKKGEKLMRQCNYCKAENADDAVYCGNCGKRIDGKIQCPNCGEYSDPTETFCTKCGTRIDGKVVCECGELVSGNFCPKCGKQVKRVTYKPSNKKRESVSRGNPLPDKAKNVLTFVGSALLGLGAIFALIFVFFTSLKISRTSGGPGSAGSTQTQNRSIYYLIGGQYSDLAKEFSGDNLQYYNSAYVAASYIHAALNTAVGLLTLLGTLTFSALTIAFSIKGMVKKTYSGGTLAVLTALFFVGGSYALLGLNYSMYEVSYGGALRSVKVELSGATDFGLVMVCLGVILGILSNVIVKIENFNVKTIVNLGTAFVMVAFSLVIFIVSAYTRGIMKTTVSGATEKRGATIIGTALGVLGSLDKDKSLSNYPKETGIYIDSLATIITVIPILILAAVLIIKLIKKGSKASVAEIVLSAILLTLTFTVLIYHVDAAGKIKDIVGDGSGESYKITYAGAVWAFVLSILMLGGAIFRKVFDNKTKTPETPAVDGNAAVAAEIKAEPAPETAETESISPIE